jgi:1-acyl-sn-glycerol-3-phosphate acyltransferase
VSASVFVGLIVPVLRIVMRDNLSRNSKVRWIINKYFVFFVGLMVFVGVIRIEIHGKDRLKSMGPRMVIANHPSYLDIVILLSLVPNACCIVNSNLLSNPLIGRIVTAAGFICNRMDSEQLVGDCILALKCGCPLIVFPEGTRTIPGRMFKFHRGFAHIVLKSGYEIQPIMIRCEPSLLAKGVPWYKVPERPAQFVIHAKQPIKASDVVDVREESSIAARKLTGHLEKYYTMEIELK